MRSSPSIIPGIDRDVYLVLDDFGRIGWAWRETDVEDTDYETVINDLLEGQFANPVRVIGFNTAEGWSKDVSEDVRGSCDNAAALRTESCPISWSGSWSGTPAAPYNRGRRSAPEGLAFVVFFGYLAAPCCVRELTASPTGLLGFADHRSRMMPHSNSAKTPSIRNIARPADVEVSSPCWCKNKSTRLSCKTCKMLSKSVSDQPRRSTDQAASRSN